MKKTANPSPDAHYPEVLNITTIADGLPADKTTPLRQLGSGVAGPAPKDFWARVSGGVYKGRRFSIDVYHRWLGRDAQARRSPD